MNKPHTEESFIALDAFAVYNEYGEADTLSQEEQDDWDRYVAELHNEHGEPPSHITISTDYADFGRCTVTGVLGNVTTYTAVWIE